jgi:hypothetical protein
MKQQMINKVQSAGISTEKLSFMSIVYDDPYNLADPEQFRASYGFLLKTPDSKLVEEFKEKLNYESTELPECEALNGRFPYRFTSSISFGSLRFYPTCWNYIRRNRKILNDIV